MKQNINIEAEGNELVLKNKAGDYVIIPKKYRLEVQDMIKENCHSCIDKLVETLPVMEDYAQDGSLYPEEPSINPNNPIKLPEVTITAEAPTYIKYRRAWAKENPFDIDKYVEDRFNNPIGREAIKRINEKAWRENLRQEGLKKRQAELDEATKMGLLYQRFNPQGKDDMPIADEQFQKRYGTSPHRYRYDNDSEYRKYYDQQARNATSTIDYPSTDLRRKDVVAPNDMWMYPNLTGETKKAMTDFSNEVIETALPIPGLDAMGKIPSVFKAGKNLIKPVSKIVGKTDDAIKAGSKVVDKVDDITENLKHLEYAKNYYSKYGYNIPENLAEIAKNSKLTDETIQGLVNQHNTFVRGVSTNWDEIAKKNPKILRHLEKKGIDYINNPQAAAEYMSTHVPIQTGYGRAGLNENVFREGKDAIYTSNSIPTAEGYTYGDGYIVKVKRPTDFSSKNRIDWIQNNKLDYFEDVIPPKRRGLLQKKYLDDSKNILKTEHLKDAENKNYILNNQLNNYIKEKGVNRISINGEYSFSGEKAPGDIIFEDVSNIQRRISDKYIDEELRLGNIGKFDEAAKLHLNKKKEIYDEIMNYMKNYPDFDPVNRYAHYLHIGTPGQKLLEPIEAIRITPDIWKNKSRAHTNIFSKGLSAGSLIPFYLYLQSQNQNKLGQ